MGVMVKNKVVRFFMDHGVYTPCCDVIIIRILHRCNVTCSGRKHVLDKVDRDRVTCMHYKKLSYRLENRVSAVSFVFSSHHNATHGHFAVLTLVRPIRHVWDF